MDFVGAAIRGIFPDQCLNCDALVDSTNALCGTCWSQTGFISGLVCDACGIEMIGAGDGTDICDDCLRKERSWRRGRAVFRYEGVGRRLVLGLKHGDRAELAKPAAGWMLQAATPILAPGAVVIPVPIHRTRLLRRRYNQSALLGRHIATSGALEFWPDALVRTRRTPKQDGLSFAERYANLEAAISCSPVWQHRMAGAEVLLVDDVMTSGATLDAAARACYASGAHQVSVIVLARVVMDT